MPEIPGTQFNMERAQAEQRFPLLRQFRNKVNIAETKVQNKGGLGEFEEPGSPNNPMPGKHTITIGANSGKLKGGATDTIIADMVHAAGNFSPEFKTLKRELVNSLGPRSKEYFKGELNTKYKNQSGSNFANIDNFLNGFVADGIVQKLLVPQKGEADELAGMVGANPQMAPVLKSIEQLFRTGSAPGKLGKMMNE